MIRPEDIHHGLSGADARTMADWINAELERDAAPVDATQRKAEGFEARRAGSAVTAEPAGAQASVDPTQEETR